MFFHEKRGIPWPLFFFGILAAGIVVATAWLLMNLLSKEGPIREAYYNQEKAEAAVVVGYKEELETLRRETEFAVTQAAQLHAKVENSLLSMHVPHGMLNEHVAAVVAVKQVDTRGKDDEVRQKLVEIVKSLEEKALKNF